MPRLGSLAAVALLAGPLALLSGACVTAQHADTARPEDAKFALSCMGGCGPRAHDLGVLIDITFTAGGAPYSRQYGICCQHVPALRARLATIRDMWCDGLDVPVKPIGGLYVGTTTSDQTGKRGATIDDGEGFVAFNCGEWLDQLIDETGKTECCKLAAKDVGAGLPDARARAMATPGAAVDGTAAGARR
jgi:hypothetical protein